MRYSPLSTGIRLSPPRSPLIPPYPSITTSGYSNEATFRFTASTTFRGSEPPWLYHTASLATLRPIRVDTPYLDFSEEEFPPKGYGTNCLSNCKATWHRLPHLTLYRLSRMDQRDHCTPPFLGKEPLLSASPTVGRRCCETWRWASCGLSCRPPGRGSTFQWPVPLPCKDKLQDVMIYVSP